MFLLLLVLGVVVGWCCCLLLVFRSFRAVCAVSKTPEWGRLNVAEARENCMMASLLLLCWLLLVVCWLCVCLLHDGVVCSW